MNRVSHLKRDHEEMFKGLLEFEDLIDEANLEYQDLIYAFHKLLVLISNHGKNQIIFLNENHGDISFDALSLESKYLKGHIRVISEAFLSKNMNYIKIVLDNDGRMFVAKVKEHIFREEMVFDRLLFSHAIH